MLLPEITRPAARSPVLAWHSSAACWSAQWVSKPPNACPCSASGSVPTKPWLWASLTRYCPTTSWPQPLRSSPSAWPQVPPRHGGEQAAAQPRSLPQLQRTVGGRGGVGLPLRGQRRLHQRYSLDPGAQAGCVRLNGRPGESVMSIALPSAPLLTGAPNFRDLGGYTIGG